MAGTDTQVAIVGGGVVGCAVAHALARRGVQVTVLEAESDLALGASGANSGILHTGFDSVPGALETGLILRSAVLREELLRELDVPVWRCGARLVARDADERAAVARLVENARANAVEVRLDADGSLSVPGEALTDPVAFVRALADGARARGADVRLGARVAGIVVVDEGLEIELAGGERLRARAGVNCAGLHADEVACMAGEAALEVYPRKGEFLVFAAPREEPLLEILLPVPSALGKGVLVFPTVDRAAVIAGPTARERTDKHDWSVEADAEQLIRARAQRAYPPLERLELLSAYAGLRPAGRDANYVIERSHSMPALIHVAAIRSTGLSASLGIGEHVASMLPDAGAIAIAIARDPTRPSRARPRAPRPGPSSDAVASLHASAALGVPASPERWWQRAARRSRVTLSPSPAP